MANSGAKKSRVSLGDSFDREGGRKTSVACDQLIHVAQVFENAYHFELPFAAGLTQMFIQDELVVIEGISGNECNMRRLFRKRPAVCGNVGRAL